MSETQWFDEIPTETGKYWFYGFLYGEQELKVDNNKKPQLSYVVVNKLPNILTYVSNGSFVYPKNEKPLGQWAKVNMPQIPLNFVVNGKMY